MRNGTVVLTTHNIYGRWCKKWSKDIMAMETSSISKLIGIWKYEERVHVLRKHVGLDLLDLEEHGIEEEL